MKIRCLLVDDEPPALDILRAHASSTPILEVVGECHHAIAAFDFIQKYPVDLIFLDVHLPKLLGTDFLKTIQRPPKVILTTAFKEYALDGFELGAVDYLLKPISLERFLKAVNKILNIDPRTEQDLKESSQAASQRFLYFRVDRKMVKVLVDEILYVEGLKDYVRIFTSTKQLITKQTISALEEMLPYDTFVRVHRSFIVSLNKIDSFTPHILSIGKDEIPIGPLYRHEMAKRLSSFC